jgi:CRISPR-associated protein Csb3
MAQTSIPVDLFNPGQVFACLGLMEAAEVLLGKAEATFDWSDRSSARFRLAAAGKQNPVEVVLDFLAAAEVRTQAPGGSSLTTEKWGVRTEFLLEGEPFPIPEPDSPATLPVVLEGPAELAGLQVARIALDHWGDGTWRDTAKFWAGAGGYPAGALVRDALDAIRGKCRDAKDDPFSLEAPQSSSFRFDWRRDNIPVDLGFNLNVQAKIETVGYPLVELLAALGLTNARPLYKNKLTYRYAVVGTAGGAQGASLLDPILLRASLGGAPLPFPQRHFCMHLDWPGKEGQARSITTVTEENTEP